MFSQNELKRAVATAALKEITPDIFIGIGTGSTVNFFIEALANSKCRINGAIASSKETEKRLRAVGIPIVNINEGPISLYIDGADECNAHGQLIKGGGAALTGEKIIAAVASQFICIIDHTKHVKKLGTFPLPVEVIPMARSYVARELVKIGGNPVLRQGVVTDYGNQILDVYHLDIETPITLEATINNITGVVTNGLFAARRADKVLIATETGVEELYLGHP